MIIVLAVVILPQSIRILREYERGVIFRLGKLQGAKGPGLIFLIPVVDRMVKMDLRVVTIDVPKQEIMTKDNVPATVDAVIYFRVVDPNAAVVKVENFWKATSLISQTTLRSVPIRGLARRALHHRRGCRDQYLRHGADRPGDGLGDGSRAGARRRRRSVTGHGAGRFAGNPGGGADPLGSTDLSDRTVAIQGLGSVGGYLAGYLKAEGARIVGSDIDPDAIAHAREIGVDIVAPEAIYDVDCDVFAPCALGAILNDDTLPRLKAKAVAGGANNQLADPARHGAEIARREILYAPDFVINAGGLINVFQEFIGYDQERALRRAKGIFDNVLRVFSIARRDGVPTAVAADRMAESRIADVKSLGPRHWDRAVLDRLSR